MFQTIFKYEVFSSFDPKVGGPHSNVAIIWTPIFEWHVVKLDLRIDPKKNNM